MTDYRVLTASVAACLVCLGCTTAPRVDVDAVAQEIRELDRQWLAAVVDKDVEAVTQFFAPDAVVMPALSPAIVGRDSIRAWFETWLPEPTISNIFVPDVVEVAASGDLAYDRGTYQFTQATPEGRISDSGKYVVVWKKIAGDWKAILDISNSDLAEPEMLPVEDS